MHSSSSSSSSGSSINSPRRLKRGYSETTSTIDITSELQAFAVAIVLTRYGMLEESIFENDIYPTDLAYFVNDLNDDYDMDFHVSPEYFACVRLTQNKIICICETNSRTS